MDEIFCVYKTTNTTEADLIKAQLEDAGIPCYFKSDNAGGVMPYLTMIHGIEIMINQEDCLQATKIIQKRLT